MGYNMNIRYAVLDYKIKHHTYKNWRRAYITSFGDNDDEALARIFHKLKDITDFEEADFSFIIISNAKLIDGVVVQDIEADKNDVEVYVHFRCSESIKKQAGLKPGMLFKRVE